MLLVKNGFPHLIQGDAYVMLPWLKQLLYLFATVSGDELMGILVKYYCSYLYMNIYMCVYIVYMHM